MRRLDQLREAGVSIWLDTLSRELLESGELQELIDDFGVSGATSNPTIFDKALGSSRYDEQLAALRSAGVTDAQAIFFELALQDVRDAARLLLPIHERTGGRDGFVSFECTPDLADDAPATVAQALELRARLDMPNVLIKVPATAAGVTAIEDLTAAGVSVNVTLLFSLQRYEEVIEAYLRGLERRLAAGSSLREVRSVASFFVSRVDAKADAALPAGSPLRGEVAIANAQLAYRHYRRRFAEPRWEALARAGASEQRPLWASTGTKDPSLSDVRYVERLIAPGVINTMPEATLRSFADHGEIAPGGFDLERAESILRACAGEGVDLDSITGRLEREGVEAFCDSYRELLARIESASERPRSASRAE
jgi:transaldolase